MRSNLSFNVLAGISIIFGILLMLENYGLFSGVIELWPVFPLFLGVGLCLLYFKRGRQNVALGMGVFLICCGLLAFYYNYTSWTAVSRTWPAFIGFFGISFLAVGIFEHRLMANLIGIFLAFLCVTFILVFTVDVRLWPISLVLFGICMFLFRRYG